MYSYTAILNSLDVTTLKGIEFALLKKSYKDFTEAIDSAHSSIHITLKCTMYFPTTTAYGLRYVIWMSNEQKIFLDRYTDINFVDKFLQVVIYLALVANI